MKAVVSEQMRKIDGEAENCYGIPGIILMENAGIKVFENIVKAGGSKERVCFICGRGNNGGDGFAAARHLASVNSNIVIYVLGDGTGIKGDALTNYNIAIKMGLDIRYIRNSDDYPVLVSELKECGILVDAVLGTGTKGEVTGLYKDIITMINEYAVYILSVDIPSGVDSDTGRILGTGVRSDRTVTLALPKVGLYLYPGADYAGEIIIEDICIPHELTERQDIEVNLLEMYDINCLFKRRERDTNKGTYGRAFIIGGSSDMIGAAAMCLQAALRCGAGIVEAGIPLCIRDRVAPLVPEAIVRALEDEDGAISYASLNSVMDGIKRSSAFALGPGLSRNPGILEIIRDIAHDANVPGVIDADGLNLISKDLSLLKSYKSQLILTPHPGEMARLTGLGVKQVQDDRIGCAREFASRYNVIIVLKGAHTIIASPEGRIYINTTGNPGMAKGGSGDILTGMIASFLSQGMEAIDAAKAAVYIHGLAGDMASLKFGEYGMKAGDIIEFIPDAIKLVSV